MPLNDARVCSETHARDFVSIHRNASCCETKPGMWSRLPWAHATRTYHPGADFSRRASKAGSAFGSFMIGTVRLPCRQNFLARGFVPDSDAVAERRLAEAAAQQRLNNCAIQELWITNTDNNVTSSIHSRVAHRRFGDNNERARAHIHRSSESIRTRSCRRFS